MPTLTKLPLYLQSRILSHLSDDEIVHYRAQLRGTNYYVPYRHPDTEISLNGVRTVNAPLPNGLLAPALASPILAAAANKLLNSSLYFLTDINTEGRLALWVKAYSPYVKAVSVAYVGAPWQACLPTDLATKMVNKFCYDTVELFKQITMSHVRLQVLDLVQVPFDKCRSMQDAMMTGLCATLESCHTTLEELAMPVYLTSDFCARALVTVTLPHLNVFSMEMKNSHNGGSATIEKQDCIGLQLLRLMRAVDGHADRVLGLTTLQELRLINMHDIPCKIPCKISWKIPCKNASDFKCSDGFFCAIKTLRVSESFFGTSSYAQLRFFSLFTSLEKLYQYCTPTQVSGTDILFHQGFKKLCTMLKEVHICHQHWITSIQVGARLHRIDLCYPHRSWEAAKMIKGKIRTLVTYKELLSEDVRKIACYCPNLEYISLFVTWHNLFELRGLIERCQRLIGMEIIIDEEEFGLRGKKGWQRLGKAIPRCHANLREIAIQTRVPYGGKLVPTSVAVNCFVAVVERIGNRAKRLAFRANVECRTIVRLMDAYCRIMNTCTAHSQILSYVEIELVSWKLVRPSEENIEDLFYAREKLRSSKEMLVQSQPHLRKIELGIVHRFLRDRNPGIR